MNSREVGLWERKTGDRETKEPKNRAIEINLEIEA
jgi:hypothetical protein